jgi:polyhydroxybutyrate depolymerase
VTCPGLTFGSGTADKLVGIIQGVNRGQISTWAMLAASAVLLAGCGLRQPGVAISPTPATGAIPNGSSTGSIESGGRRRTYRIYRPAAISATQRVPLVVFLHGGFGDGQQAEQSYGWDEEADAGAFIVIYPDGVSKAWNGGTCCGQPMAQDIDDVGFIKDLVAKIESETAIDMNRVYATGISNGGIMAYRLACETDLFAAIGPDSATMLVSCANAPPASVIAIHGTADHNIPYDGGVGSGTAHVDGPAVPDVIARWEGIDTCAAPGTAVAASVRTAVAECPQGRNVELVTIDGAGHQWPGGKPSTPAIAALLGLDEPSTALNATSTIWAFFAAHPKT